MKHAYLILAHGDFIALDHLVRALDDIKNDVFIHIDKRVKSIPSFKMTKGGLFLLEKRIKTYWGDYSLLEAEFLLMHAAYKKGVYSYYHIISGAHFPLKKQDYVHSFYESYYPNSLLLTMKTTKDEIIFKTGRYHFFVKYLAPKGTIVSETANFFWRLLLFLQKPFPHRNIEGIDDKASQWCSLTDEAVGYIISQSILLKKRFRKTFCCDEFFIPMILKKGSLSYESVPNLLYVKFRRYSPKVLQMEDYDSLMSSGCLFARKFGDNSEELIEEIKKSYDEKNTHIRN